MHTLRPTHSESCFPSSSTCSPPHLSEPTQPSLHLTRFFSLARSAQRDRTRSESSSARAGGGTTHPRLLAAAGLPSTADVRSSGSAPLFCQRGFRAETRFGRCGLQTDGESWPEVRSLLSARASCGVVAASWPRSAPPPPFLPPLARSPPRALASTTYEHTDCCTARSRSQRTAAPPPSPAHLAVRLPRTRTRSSPRAAPVSLKVRPRSHSPPQRSTRTSS